ncbi:MAG: 3-methyl-2-oxobutanoate dehydrogenase subunit VorB [Oscillospiraceae bacterium]|nr:3-methyl-2-oxobutanoate dehydrogenase subunit VorB [Oscillospiraceae bacterium]
MSERVLMKGNEALAEAAILAGCRHFFGYPITPQTELAAYMSKRLPKVGGVFLQAESEIAAINMVQGAAAAGVRAMTSSSSPGISLKTEGISYMCGSNLPCVIVNIQRGGPGLGGIQPSQADYCQAVKAPGHGDLHILVSAPATVQEMVDLAGKAFDLADKYRMPAMILADGMLGQMMEPVVLPGEPAGPLPKKEWAASGHNNGRPKNIINSLYLDPYMLEESIKKRYERYKIIEENESLHENYLADDAEIVLVSYGATSRVAKAAINMARGKGIRAGLLRPLTLYPFPKKAVAEAAKTAKAFISVEMSMGQMVDDIRLACDCSVPVEFFGRTGGVIPNVDEILGFIEKTDRRYK